MLGATINYWMGPVDGPDVVSNVHLLDTASAFIGGEGAGPFLTWTDTGLTATMLVTGATASEAQANHDAIDAMLTRSKRAKGIYGNGQKIILSCEQADGEWRYLDVTGGTISPIRAFVGGQHALVTLTLTTLPHMRGERYTASLSPSGALTNGAMTAFITGIPGTASALGRLAFTDGSTGVVINGVRIGGRSGTEMQAGDVDLIHDLTAAGVGETVTEASAVGGSVVSAVPGSAWATIAQATIPGTAYSISLYELYVRMRDETTNITPPLSLSVTNIPYRLVGSSTGNAANPTVTLSGVRAGEWLTLCVMTPGTPATPAGWTLRVSNGATYLYDKLADGTETSVTLTGATAGGKRLYVYGWTGLTAAPADKTSSGTGTSTTASTGTTGVLAQAAEVAVVLTNAGGATATPAAGFTEILDNILHVQYRVTVATTALNPSTTLSSSQTWQSLIATYRVELNGQPTSSAPNLAAGTYSVRVAAKSTAGGIGQLTNTVSKAISANQLLLVDWEPPDAGIPATARIWFTRGSGWKYIDTTDARSQAVIHTETGATAGDPPNTLVGANHLIRARVSTPSGATGDETDSTTAAIANSATELRGLGLAALPPTPPQDDGTVEDALVTLEAAAQMETIAPLVVDALLLFPHAPDDLHVEAHVRGRAMTAKADWLIETRRDEVTVGKLFAPGTTTDAGTLVTNDMPLVFGPGSAQLVIHAEVAGGVSSTAAVLTPTLLLTPRWWLPNRERGAA
jgi:hypothetical protein